MSENTAPAEGQKLTGAALKAAKKAAKQAERAQKKGPGGDVGQDATTAQQQEQPAAKKPQKGKQDAPAQSKGEKSSKQQQGKEKQSAPAKQTGVVDKPKTKGRDNNVAIFAHLSGQERRHGVANAPKDIHPAIQILGQQYATYQVCGSSARCVAMLIAFKAVINSYTTPPGNSLARHLTAHYLPPQIDFLKQCRPLNTCMGNAIRWIKDLIVKIDPNTPEMTAKEDLNEAIDNFIRERFLAADQLIAQKAAEKIVNGDVILTYAKSSIVLKSILEAKNQGKRFQVIVVDTQPLFEGKQMAKDIAEAGINVSYYLVPGAAQAIQEATKVFVGAHAMLSNGVLQSRVGTAIIAMHARGRSIPVLVCCETIKFTDQVALESITKNELAPDEELLGIIGGLGGDVQKYTETHNLQILNIMYDYTPTDYINMVVTESGYLPPSSVPAVLRSSGIQS